MSMKELKCKNCTAPINPSAAQNNVITCAYCGSVFTLPKEDTDPAALDAIRTGNHELDICRFDDAYESFKKAAQTDPAEPEAYIGMAYATHKVQYIKDEVNNRLQPICHEVSDKVFTQDKNYKTAISLATEKQREQYIKHGGEIDYIRKEFCKLKNSGLDYDCFICVKVTDDETKGRTADYKTADDLYFYLRGKGYKPFFSEREIQDKTGADYEALILYALYSSECMLVVCGNESYLQTPWVKNEYTRFLKLVADEEKESDSVAIVFSGRAIERLPGRTGKLQGIDMRGVDPYGKVTAFVHNHTPEAKKKREKEKAKKLAEEEARNRELDELRKWREAQEKSKSEEDERNRELNEFRKWREAQEAAKAEEEARKQREAQEERSRRAAEEEQRKRELEEQRKFLEEQRKLQEKAQRELEEKLNKLQNMSVAVNTAAPAGRVPVDSGMAGNAVVTRVMQYFDDDDLPGAEAYLTRMSDSYPDSGDVWWGRVLINLGMHDGMPVQELLTSVKSGTEIRLLRLDPNLTRAKKYAKGALAAKIEQFEKGLSDLEREFRAANEKAAREAKQKEEEQRIAKEKAAREAKQKEEEQRIAKEKAAYEAKQSALLRSFELKGSIITAYKGSKSDVVIPDAVTEVGIDAFANSPKLKTLTLNDNLTRFHFYDFEKCPNLCYNTYGNAKYLGSESNPYFLLAKAESTDIQSCTVHENTKMIGPRAFTSCKKLESVTLPKDLLGIESHAFGWCHSLKNITLPEGLKTIGFQAFLHCGLESLILPDGLDKIESDAFKGCDALKGVYIPAKFKTPSALKKIGLSSTGVKFYKNSDEFKAVLKEQEEKVRKEAEERRKQELKEQEEKAREEEKKRKEELAVKQEYDRIYGKYNIKDGCATGYKGTDAVVRVPDGVKVMCDTFKQNHTVKDVEIPASVEKVGDRSFCGCEALEKVKIGRAVEIGERTFFGCESLTDIKLPENLESIGTEAFGECFKLKNIELPDGLKEIKGYAFKKSGLKKVTLPDSVTTLGDSVFKECKSLTSCKLPERIERLEPGMFSECDSLTKIAIPDSVTLLGAHLFQFCKNLVSVSLPKNIKFLPNDLFLACKKLSEVIVPDGVTVINDSAFYACESLTSFSFPKKLVFIKKRAFTKCNGLTEIVIPDTVTTIEESAFEECAGLKKVVFSGTVSSIGEKAFAGCRELKEVVFSGTVSSIGILAFLNCNKIEKVTMPKKCKKLAKDAFGFRYKQIDFTFTK